MKEILAKLVESEVLTEDTRKEVTEKLNEAIETQVNEKVENIVWVKKAELEESFKENFESEREKLVEAIDTFLDKEMEGALSESIRNEYKEKFLKERTNLIENISIFLELEFDKLNESKIDHDHAAELAFYESVKSLMLGEQDVPSEAENVIKGLQESLQKKEARVKQLFARLVESNRKEESTQLESKIEDFVRMLPQDKKSIGRKLVEGVALEDFDKRVKDITPELITESDDGDNVRHGTSNEVIVESHTEEVDADAETIRIRQL